ncbi:MAG: TetR/AcrR family transcriptional regulator [Clostridiales bacterium]|nr:TetR/AcrR family transcriptional regulator [Clostridiales bacterium]MDD7035178.1 TetR/AcrR family transcriptional regulator [Bacillota bacterium]MDY2920024.1 TetR/AcrR family transcriptional regulator [Lentihominibacter sp.]
MSKKSKRDTKGKIISAAWDLFYEQGYEETTVEEIVEASGTSKGSFYHYFDGKDALLGTLSYMFDKKYEELKPQLESFDTNMDKLLFLNRELFAMIENSISLDLVARLFSTQLTTKGEKHLLDRDREYYRLLRKICTEGQESGEFRDDLSVNDLTKLYALTERALMYDWCLCNGEYSLKKYSEENLPHMLSGFISH